MPWSWVRSPPAPPTKQTHPTTGVTKHMNIQSIFTNPEKFWFIQYSITDNTAHTLRVKEFKFVSQRRGKDLSNPFIGLNNVGKFGAAIHKDATHWGIVYIESDEHNPIFIHQQKFATTTKGVLRKTVTPYPSDEQLYINSTQSIATITVFISKINNQQVGILS